MPLSPAEHLARELDVFLTFEADNLPAADMMELAEALEVLEEALLHG